MATEIRFQKHKLSDVLHYFTGGFKPAPNGEKVTRCLSSTVDPATDAVVFELLVETPDDLGPG